LVRKRHVIGGGWFAGRARRAAVFLKPLHFQRIEK
jgi:hypothetical protein